MAAITLSRTRRRILLALAILTAMAVLHRPILRLAGQWLVVEDPARKVDAIYVLSGNPADRGAEAARLYTQGHAPEVVCLGGERNFALQMYGIRDLSCKLSHRSVAAGGVPETAIRDLPEGTSTYEEFEAIKRDCKARGYKQVMVVSSRFHTRRIHAFFRLPLYFEGIDMVLRGAYEADFEENQWWLSEPGLLFVTNEYIKYTWYFIRH